MQTGSCLDLTTWDDETSSPSYTTTTDGCGDEDECLIVGYKKPPLSGATDATNGRADEDECVIVGYKKPIAEDGGETSSTRLPTHSETDEEEETTSAAEIIINNKSEKQQEQNSL